MIDGSDIAGDGVNVASRLESLAEPGGICVSGSVREQVHGQLDVSFVDIGEQRVKNIERPIRVYRIDLQSGTRRAASRPVIGASRRWLAWPAAIVLIVVISVGGWLLTKPPQREAAALPAMSLAIAPFTSAGGNADDEKHAAALRQDLVTGIGAVERRVSLRSAGARYTLSGDVRRAGDGYSASVLLADNASGAQAWSGSFALPVPDASNRSAIAVRKLVAAVANAIEASETRRVVALPIERLDATELVVRGWATFDVAPTLANARAAQQLFDAALRLDPNNVRALRNRATIADLENDVDPSADHERIVREMDDFSARALKLDGADPSNWRTRMGALFYLGRWNAATEAIDQAIRLDPYDVNLYIYKAWVMNMTGRPAEALSLLTKAAAMEPAGPDLAFQLIRACEAHLLSGQAREAIENCEKASGLDPGDWFAHLFLVAAYMNAGEPAKATAAKAAVDRIVPGYTVAQLRAKGYSNHPEYLKLAERYWYDGLRKAGVPER